MGGSSTGTLVAGAVKWCQKQTSPKRVVTFICDTGNKYLSKAFNKSWLHDNDLLEVQTAGDVTDLINRRADQGDMISVSVSDTLLTAYKRMRASDISQIPVLDGEQLVGVLDEEDLLFNVSKSKTAFHTAGYRLYGNRPRCTAGRCFRRGSAKNINSRQGCYYL